MMDEPSDEYIERKEKLLSAIQSAGRVQEGDRRELYDILTLPSMQRALHEVLIESDANAGCLLALNLEDPRARYEAALAQGSARGLLRAVESLIDHIPVKQKEK
jgi:hypothetical protein